MHSSTGLARSVSRPFSLVGSVALFVLATSCHSSSSHGDPSDGGIGDAFGGSIDGGHVSKGDAVDSCACEDAGSKTDAGESHTSNHGCTDCDGGSQTGTNNDSGHDTSADAGHGTTAHDAGHDAGHTQVAPTGAHTTGVSIAVPTASGTMNRTYDITVPATCSSSHLVPLVFVFHGDGGNGADMYCDPSSTASCGGLAIEAAAAAAGGEAIFVYPDGLDDFGDSTCSNCRAWDLYHDPGAYPYTYTAGQPAPAMSDDATGNVDIDFFDTMVQFFEQNYCVDTSKIFITGMSSGGYLSDQFARWRSGIVKGTAPQSGGAPFGNPDGTNDWSPPNYCVGTTGKVPALIIHGLSDGTVDPCNSFEEQSYWELANGCSDSANNCTTNADSCTGSNLAEPSTAPTTTSTLNSDCLLTSGCGSNPVVLCQIPGMGHQIWSNAGQVIWSFFASL